jgi:hypothetical protein
MYKLPVPRAAGLFHLRDANSIQGSLVTKKLIPALMSYPKLLPRPGVS